MSFLDWLATSNALSPHGFCLLWEPGLLWLNAGSDALIMVAYYSIPLAILQLARKRRDLVHLPITWLFVIFIAACGTTHLMSMITLWVAAYHAEVTVKIITAAASVLTAILLWPLLPKLLATPSLREVKDLNTTLTHKVVALELTEGLLRKSEQSLILSRRELQQSHDTLELRVAERTAELSQLNAAISQNEARFRAVVEAIPSAMILVGTDGNIWMVNTQAERMFGYARDAMLDCPIEMLIPTRLVASHPALREEFTKSRTPRAMGGRQPIFARRQDGGEFEVEIGLVPLDTDQGRKTLAAITDVSERRRMEAEVEETRVKMITAGRLSALGEMAGGIAHEINNPLAVIYALASELTERADEGGITGKEVADTTRVIEHHSERIAKIVVSMRRIARDGDHDPLREVSLGETVDYVLGLCSERFRNHSVALFCDPIEPDIRMSCKEVQICQVLVNLLQNALDAALEQPGERWVRLTAATDGTVVEFAVTDCGHGIEPDLKARIMEPFFTTKPIGKGTGLGLSLSKRIAEDHGGSIEIAESPEGNTRLVFRVPLQEGITTCS